MSQPEEVRVFIEVEEDSETEDQFNPSFTAICVATMAFVLQLVGVTSIPALIRGQSLDPFEVISLIYVGLIAVMFIYDAILTYTFLNEPDRYAFLLCNKVPARFYLVPGFVYYFVLLVSVSVFEEKKKKANKSE